ncbi:MAG: hypothetical protein GPI92_02570 [Microcystis aeruginosa K13-06]|uniref:Mobile element protein n=1 Tax=Microcystis aeruginosa Ma_QC_C_20070703_M131 TaxID=2486263 RepID=A0A551Y5E8_MICAE|nr:hypothetical protein [Microcystis aeruginosa K13-06]NCR98128.1 hypothetical protein [Microcystis aeruginosa L311-01]QHU83829.1 hypothetical protein D3800_11100 [Microcystis aeruginosa NIES-298]TRT56177.1 MAG: hypothetical protein EWV85_08210 [Microcystis aeruginosa Ma_QC_C_20070703_M131]TRU04761.1 MAG: hypothetical protein EWV59_23340 [Microcystis aeruginosa Ma_MB_F_20061100_S19D]TRU13796.1 MAG: hypothetical protein EWV58_13710 [Microcystis aeruginosa Ma_MB_F_20061100_S19]
MGFLRGNSLLKLGVTFDFITQSKLLGGSTPQTPRWGRGAAPKPRSALVFRWDAYTRLFIFLY